MDDGCRYFIELFVCFCFFFNSLLVCNDSILIRGEVRKEEYDERLEYEKGADRKGGRQRWRIEEETGGRE